MDERKHWENKEEKTEMKIDNDPDNNISKVTEKIKGNPWITVSIVLGIAVIILLFINFKGRVTGNVILGEDAGTKIIEYLNSRTGGGVEYVSNKDIGSLYEVTVSYQGQEIPVYVTKDGEYFVQGAIPITGDVVDNSATNIETPQEVPKSDKPRVELFVMSFCPYGVRAENNILPILKLLGDKIDFKIRFIVNVNGDKIEDVGSLHGLYEAKEDARQLIINKYYPSKFLTYIENFNKVCYPLGNDESKIDTCWKSEAAKLGIDVKKIESSAYGSEGVTLLKSEESAANQYGASGSPTLIINGIKSSAIYSGTSATQTAICSAFNTVPIECETVVQAADTTAATAGSC